jgi:hypothetical protein
MPCSFLFAKAGGRVILFGGIGGIGMAGASIPLSPSCGALQPGGVSWRAWPPESPVNLPFT